MKNKFEDNLEEQGKELEVVDKVKEKNVIHDPLNFWIGIWDILKNIFR